MASAKRPAYGQCCPTKGRVATAPATPSSTVVCGGAGAGGGGGNSWETSLAWGHFWLQDIRRNTPSPAEGTGPLALEQMFPFPPRHLFQAVFAHKVPTLWPLLTFDSMAMLFCPHRCPFQISKFRFSGLFRRGLLLINWPMLDTKEATKKKELPLSHLAQSQHWDLQLTMQAPTVENSPAWLQRMHPMAVRGGVYREGTLKLRAWTPSGWINLGNWRRTEHN